MIIVSASIRHFNTALALGSSQRPCYLRARVLDHQNATVYGVKIALEAEKQISKDDIPALKASPGGGHHRSSTMQDNFFTVNSYVEEVSSPNSPPAGICLPIGCNEMGILYATPVGQDLNFLEPEIPSPTMGEVRNVSPNHGIKVPSSISTSNAVSTRSSEGGGVFGENLSPHFFSKNECLNSQPEMQTYVFRDTSNLKDGRELSRISSSYNNRVVQIFRTSPAQNSPSDTFCHLKVHLQLLPGFFSRNKSVVVEAVTLQNVSAGQGHPLMLGWRQEPVTERTNRTLCIEYLCNFKETPKVYVTIRYTDPSYDEPRCQFSPRDTSIFSNFTESFSSPARGGVIYFPEEPIPKPQQQQQRALNYGHSSKWRTLSGSKRLCEKSSYISAYFHCW